MKTYKVVLTKSAEKELTKLPSTVILKIVPELQSLENLPRPNGCKKLKGFENLWRIRVGDYRVIYSIEDVILVVEVQAIGHRRNVYE
jgi:mRNA interferase RelE/StbE